MPSQICVKCEREFLCNCSCGAKSYTLGNCLCGKCWREENEDKDSEWKREFIEHDSCDRKEKD